MNTLSPRRGRVLVIDDEPAIGRSVARILGAEQQVTAVTSASEALDRLGRGEQYDLILCDLVMPNRTGRDLYEELKRTAPEVVERVVFVSGGVSTSAARQFLDEIPNERFDKPMTAHDLRALARRYVR